MLTELRRLFVAMAVMVIFTTIPALAQTDSTTLDKYVLGPEDVVTIQVRDVPEASGEFLIRLDGKFSMPLVGEVQALGLSVEQLRNFLTDALKKELRDPEVTVNLKQMRVNRIYVLGMVGAPGVQDYRPGWRLTELIASAGGLQLPPERVRALIIRRTGTIKIEMRRVFVDGDDSANIVLQPGDVISVQTDPTLRIYMVGAVNKPGTVNILEKQGAVEALAAAGGEVQQSALSRAKIVRGGKEIPVNLYEAIKNGKSEFNVALEDNDTIYIPTVDAKVAVIGQVKSPGSQIIPDGKEWTLSQAISQAGGPAAEAKLDGVTVLRRDATGKIQNITVNYKKFLRNKVTDYDMTLQDRDVVFIAQSGKPNLGFISSVMSTAFWPLRMFDIVN